MLDKLPLAWRALLLLAAMALPSSAQLTYSGCSPVQASDFSVVPLVTKSTNADIKEPLKLALRQTALGNVDVYFTQRHGKVRLYKGDTKTLVTLVDFALESQIDETNSEGMVGIALDPDFGANGWVYLYFAIESSWRISRYTLTGSQISPSSEKVILKFTTGGDSKHMAGALRFDWDGNLWITVADNENKGEAANTNSYLGKIIRIKPRPFADSQTPAPGKGSTYDIPNGNLFTDETAAALPEIYVMGVRNPYSIALDPVRKGVAWGDVGPDNFSGSSLNPAQFTEEHNYTTKPGFFGWPYWAGNNISLSSGGSLQSPNGSGSGIKTLPAAIPAINPFARACAITGPIYRFDASNPSKIKFPPHFDGAWLLSDLNRSWVDVAPLNAAGTQISGTPLRIIAYESPALTNPIDMDFGPDGALYVVNYNGYRTTGTRSGLMRVEYKGPCQVPVSARPRSATIPGKDVEFADGVVRISLAGRSLAEVRDVSGRIEWRRDSQGPWYQDLRERLKPGLHVLTVSHATGHLTAKFVQ
ncbi:MAG: PQQ-dependent sugar dehydrogenase [Fibrobacteria bacterium]